MNGRVPSRFGKLLISAAMLAGAMLAGPIPVALAADVPCTVQGTQGDDQWEVAGFDFGVPAIAADAVVCGGGGNDIIWNNEFTTFSGTFYGGKGEDVVGHLTGTFEGGPGRDFVVELAGGSFSGGQDTDVVQVACGGKFVGGPGADVAGVGTGTTSRLKSVETVIDVGIAC